MKDKIYNLVFLSDLHATRILLAISELIWGAALLMPGCTFSRSRTYAGLSEIASEEWWGVVWMLSGIMQAYIVYTQEYHSAVAVRFAAFNSILWWVVVSLLYTHVWPINAVASGDFALCVAATWVFIRSGWQPKPCRGVDQWM